MALTAVALLCPGCEGDSPSVDDGEQRQQIEDQTDSIERAVDERKSQTTAHLDEARDQVEDAVDEADHIAEEAFEVIPD